MSTHARQPQRGRAERKGDRQATRGRRRVACRGDGGSFHSRDCRHLSGNLPTTRQCRHASRSPLQPYPLHLVEADRVAAPVVELGGAGRGVVGHGRGVF